MFLSMRSSCWSSCIGADLLASHVHLSSSACMLLCDARGVVQEGITSADVHYACYVMTQSWTISAHVHFIVFAGTGCALFSYSTAMAGVTLLYGTRPQSVCRA